MKTALEILKKIRRLEIKSKWQTNQLFSGSYKSAFKGQGMIFQELREYQYGDDIRFIDWNVSARMQRTYTKVFEEERETTVYILLDNSSSTLFGTSESKRDLITQLCADLAYSTIKNNDKTGLIIFNDLVETHIPPSKKPEQIQYFVKVLAAMQTAKGKTNISKALEYINNIMFQKSIIFVISDFMDNNFEKPLGILSKRHHVVGLHISDKMDKELPNIGLVEVSDLETGERYMINTSNKAIQQHYTAQYVNNINNTVDTFKKTRASLLQLETGNDYHTLLQNFLML